MKIGIDYHGVIDANPEFFSFLASAALANGIEVHIVTGVRDTPELRRKLKEFDIPYTCIFSILSHHESIGTPIWYDEDKNPWMNEAIWDRTKGEYAAQVGLDIHFDDTERYEQYFPPKTSFILYRKKTSNEQ